MKMRKGLTCLPPEKKTHGEAMQLISEGRKFVYFINESVTNRNGEYIPCIAIEGVSGYYRTDWYWGKDLKLAEECAEGKNEIRGISREEAIKIVFSTMSFGKGG